MVCIKMPDNRHYFIALTIHAFSDYICDWIGKFHDCYIFHSASSNTPFQKFGNSKRFSDIFKIDEEEKLSPATPEIETQML